MIPLISATSQDDHIRVEIYGSCIVEWSDDDRTWHVLRGDQVHLEDGIPVVKDYEVPLNGSRSYRAYNRVPETVHVTRREPGYVVPSLEETRRKLAELMNRGTPSLKKEKGSAFPTLNPPVRESP